MRIIEPKDLKHRRAKSGGSVAKRLVAVLLVVVLFIGLLAAVQAYNRPLPAITSTTNPISVPKRGVALNWPANEQAAIGALGYGLLADNGSQQPAPMASVAKVVTALAVLRKDPLVLGQQGPTLTMSGDDVALYDSYAGQDGSVVAVSSGEQISEYQALEAMLLPSANNMADSLANWAFGSMDAYLAYANSLVAGLGLNQTHLADASGFSSATVSSAHDLVLLGNAALSNPVLAQIVSLGDADIPVAGRIHNVNYLLGQNGIVGIKTGNTSEAGGCYLFAAKHDYGGGQTVTVVGAIMGAPTLEMAMSDSLPLLTSSYLGFGSTTVVKGGQVVGRYYLPWDGSVAATAQHQLTVFGWTATPPSATVKLTNVASITSTNDNKAGQISVQSGGHIQSVSIVTAQPITKPGFVWRTLGRSK